MPLALDPSWVGRRVSVRRALDRDPDGRVRFGDVVGDLLALTSSVATLETREGVVGVASRTIALARLAPPSTADELALEAVAARGWRAAQTGSVGGWLLRASGGFTGRGNSVLPLRPAGLPVTEALQQARAWYAERGLPLRLQVPCEARRLLDAELGELGWQPSPDVHVMAARLDMLAGGGDGAVELAAVPDEAWFACYRDGAGAGADARALLTRHDHVTFASLRRDGEVAAIGRGAVDDGWLGITAVEVAPGQRRRGLARAVMAALAGWGRAEGALRSYLQVSADNAAAVALYRSLGYWTHHDYRYRTEPAHGAHTAGTQDGAVGWPYG